MMSYFYILLTILLTVYGQLVINWQVLKAGILPCMRPPPLALLRRRSAKGGGRIQRLAQGQRNE